jgi:Tol biopolymer transport system component
MTLRHSPLLAMLLALPAHAQTRESAPAWDGQLFFHRYTNYDAWDGRLYLYDFARKTLTCLSERWPINHAMNAHVAPDGKRLVFMGVPRGRHDGRSWDVYLWEIGSACEPVNLTTDNGLRDEDPKFSPDGRTIVFKQDGRLAFMDLDGKNVRALPNLPTGGEWSMPIFTADGRTVVAMAGARDSGDLFAVDRDGKSIVSVATTPRVQEYYPVTWDAKRLLYVRWRSAEDHNDLVYRYVWADQKADPLPFCEPDTNNSDPWPMDDRWVIFSSTRPGGKGGYDLYLGDSVSGQTVSLDGRGINTPAEELGACYRPRRR